MRKPFAAVLMLGLASVAMSQEGRQKTEAEPPPRFGVNFKGRVYPQATPREALTSLIEAAEKGDANYLVAHLLEPSFVDARMADRAKQFEPQVEANLAALRDYQQKNLDRVAPEVRVPVDAVKFRDRVQTDAKAAAFKQLVKDVQEKFVEDPETMKAMRLYRSGTFPENPGDLVKLGHVDVKNRVLFIKKIADRYYIENRQSDGAEAAPAGAGEEMIDLRSDTLTKPTPGMLAAMMSASVGDDVYGEDPAVNELERRTADLLGMEAALFVPTGTMSNQIAVRVHCRPQDELLIESTSHIYLWEAGAPAALSGVTQRTIDGRFGILDVSQLEDLLHPDDMHSVRSRLVCLENTHNRGGGTVYPLDKVKAISTWARSHGLAMHLDGARLWNAIVASGISAKEWAKHFDTVSVCYSKGLGSPLGSALAGPKDLIAHGRRVRKLFGGAMRQVGYMAAACQYAMERHVDRLAEDHANAKLIAAAVAEMPGFKLLPPEVETNLVWFEVGSPWKSARDVAMKLKDSGVLVAALGAKVVRAVTHLDVSRADCEKAADLIRMLKP